MESKDKVKNMKADEPQEKKTFYGNLIYGIRRFVYFHSGHNTVCPDIPGYIKSDLECIFLAILPFIFISCPIFVLRMLILFWNILFTVIWFLLGLLPFGLIFACGFLGVKFINEFSPNILCTCILYCLLAVIGLTAFILACALFVGVIIKDIKIIWSNWE